MGLIVIFMGVHHHILLWLIIIYLIVGVIFYFMGGSVDFWKILTWPADAFQSLMQSGLIGQSKPSTP
jgi:hypothetical protein